MIQHNHTQPPRPAVSVEATTPFDVLWGKPLFRAPNLPAQIIAPAEVPFTAQRITAPRRAIKP